MKPIPKLLPLALCILAFAAVGDHDAFASGGRYYPDITAVSPSKKFKVTAISPDNIGEKTFRPTFQKSFVYTFRAVGKDEVLWTRKQPMKTGTYTSGPYKGKTYTTATEESPEALFVSDGGWTVIRTGGDKLILVDITGKDRGIFSLLKDGLTEEENKKYVVESTAGPIWKGCSLWYFSDAGEQPLFIITPWWGRRIILDLNSARQISETPDIAKQALLCEKNFVLAELRRDASSLDKPSPPPGEYKNQNARINEYRRFMTAAYVAGRNKIAEAIPMLEELQYSSKLGITSIGDLRKNFSGEIDPSNYSTFPLRQVAQLSLRRLGKTPEQLPATQFYTRYGNVQHYPFDAGEIDVPRAENTGKIKYNMSPKEVLDLIGEPDFSRNGTRDWPWGGSWQYDMDAETPFTLLVCWSTEGKVARVEQKTPPYWQDLTRDRELFAYFWRW